MMDLGWQYGSNERTVVKGIKIISGTRGLTNRVEYLYSPDQIVGNEIDLLVTPRIVDIGLPKPKRDVYTEHDATVVLFKETSDIIRGDGIIVNDTCLQSLDSPDLSERRIEWVRDFVRRVPVIFLEGTPQQIAEVVESMF